VEALDTNVVVRLLVLDDEDQCRRAEQLLRRAVPGGEAWVGTIVLVDRRWC
jgi:predicted nucleic-acid-binding protein